MRPLRSSLFILAAALLPLSVSAATILKPVNNLGLGVYFPFNEGTSTVATDFSGNLRSGKLGTFGASVATWVDGKFGKAVYFDGGNDYVSWPGFSSGTSFTYAAWIKPDGQTNANGALLADNPPSVGLWYEGSAAGANAGKLTYYVSADNFNNTPLVNGVWTHVVVSVSAGNGTFYINGVPDGTFSIAGFVVASTMGDDGSNEPFKGTLDEVRFYTRALSAAEATALYRTGAGRASASSASLTNGTTLGNGLVALWSFDGSSMNWTSATAGTVSDGSGRGNTGTLTGFNRANSIGTGKLGQAAVLGGSSYIPVTLTSGLPVYPNSTSYTVAGWVKGPLQPDGTIYAENIFPGVLSISSDSSGTTGKLNLYLVNNAGTTLLNDVLSTGTVFDNTWHHIVWSDANGAAKLYIDGVLDATDFSYTRTGTFPFNTAAIGSQDGIGGLPFVGSLDDLRIYSRALSAPEAKQLYQLGVVNSNASSASLTNGSTLGTGGGLAGLWTFDGGDSNWTGANAGTVTDRSGNGNTGTYTNMSKTASPVPGKHGQAISFDGVDDTVSVTYSAAICPASITVSTWIYLNALTTTTTSGGATVNEQYIYGKQDSIGITAYTLYKRNDHKLEFYITNSVASISTTALSAGQWYHVVGTYDGSNVRIYVNGVLEDTDPLGGGYTCNSTPLTFGNRGLGGGYDAYFNGRMDDARIYNRALSAAEIGQLYRLGR